MDEKKKSLLAEDSDKDSICSGLAQLAEVCSPAVDSLAGCKGREYADNLVAIHVNSMSGGRQSTPFPAELEKKVSRRFAKIIQSHHGEGTYLVLLLVENSRCFHN